MSCLIILRTLSYKLAIGCLIASSQKFRLNSLIAGAFGNDQGMNRHPSRKLVATIKKYPYNYENFGHICAI